MRMRLGLLLLAAACAAHGQGLVVYDDALRNGFVAGYSYGGGTVLAQSATTHQASAAAIGFTGDAGNAVAFPNETIPLDTTQYAGIRMFVHGGAAGGQQLRLQVYDGLGGAPLANVELDAFIAGGALVAGAWRQVDVAFADLGVNGPFDRFDLQSDGAGAQPTVYIDDVQLVGAGVQVFADGFDGEHVEPELLFVPQYTSGEVRVYQRNAGGFGLQNTAVLPAGSAPNAVAFAPDGKLWVVDTGATNRLLRFSPAAVANEASPVPEVVIGPVGGDLGDLFDLAFHGDFAYVSNGFGTDRILRYPLSSLEASGNPAATALANAALSVPAGLEFDAQGRLWISNYGNQTIVRMDPATGMVDRIGSSVASGARASLSAPEGLAFDAEGSLWVGNNGAPTVSAYAAWQLDAMAATTPVHLLDLQPGVLAPGPGHTGFVGGLAFDRDGTLWINDEHTFSVLQYELQAGPRAGGEAGVGSYVATPGDVLEDATTDPGFGGVAFWPVPPTVQRGQAGPAVFRGTTLVGMESAFTFFDPATGPVENEDYPRHDERLIDYFASKGMTAIRFLVCWEALQPQLMGPVPAQPAGNYRTYFDNYLRIVDYATNVKGMTVLVTPWQYDDEVPGTGSGGIGGPTWRGDLVGSPEVPLAAWTDFWGKLAALFADNPRVQYVLVTEPNHMSTMAWWAIAQAGVTAIRDAGATQRIYVPGNGYSAASTWVIDDAFYDTAPVRRSNAYGWLNANGPGQPITDPMDNMAAEVHTYLDPDQGGASDAITSVTAAREQLAVVVEEARLRGYQVYLGEIGMRAGQVVSNAPGMTAEDAWDDFIAYFEANNDTLTGFTWWAGGDPAWWSDVGANGGGHYSISPTSGATYTGDTINMDMIEADF